MAALVVLIFVVVTALCAPLYQHNVSHSDPVRPNFTGTTVVNGKTVPVLGATGNSLAVLPIGPTWQSNYFLGADTNGRDVVTRVLYGGRASLLVGGLAALLCCVVGAGVGIAAGYFRGAVDAVLSRIMDLIWGFPFYFLAISLASVLATQSLKIGPIELSGSSPLAPTLIIGYVFVPYVARPIRAMVLSLREREFIEAGIVSGGSSRHLLFKEVMPNVLPIIITLFPIMMSRTVLTEAILSFLGVGIRPPNPSWGGIINEGQSVLYSRPWISLSAGIMLTITLVALAVFGEALRDELDRRGRTRVPGKA
jgi:peptide/nickel transport system permease protein